MRETLYRTFDFLNQIQAIANAINTYLIARSAVPLKFGSAERQTAPLLQAIRQMNRTQGGPSGRSGSPNTIAKSRRQHTNPRQHEARPHSQPKRSSLNLMLRFSGVSLTELKLAPGK
jgi:hypothetical protein